MEKQYYLLPFGAPLQFRDRWDGRLLACEVDPQWAVQNLVLVRGLLRRQRVRVPFSAVSHWDNDVVAFSAAADEVFAGAFTPAALPTNKLSSQTALAGADAKLVGLLVHRDSRKASHLLLEQGRVAPQQRMLAIDRVSVGAGTIKLAAQLETAPLYRSDGDLMEAVRQAIATHLYLSEDDRRGLTVEAVDGVIYLGGNVRTLAARNWAQECARQVPGALAIRNEIIDDTSLELAVGQALAAAGLFRQARVFVRSIKGALLLTGFAPSPEVVSQIQKVAAAVAGVRTVTTNLQIPPPQPAAEPTQEAAAS